MNLRSVLPFKASSISLSIALAVSLAACGGGGGGGSNVDTSAQAYGNEDDSIPSEAAVDAAMGNFLVQGGGSFTDTYGNSYSGARLSEHLFSSCPRQESLHIDGGRALYRCALGTYTGISEDTGKACSMAFHADGTVVHTIDGVQMPAFKVALDRLYYAYPALRDGAQPVFISVGGVPAEPNESFTYGHVLGARLWGRGASAAAVPGFDILNLRHTRDFFRELLEEDGEDGSFLEVLQYNENPAFGPTYSNQCVIHATVHR